VTRVAYNGHEALTFTGYLDLESGKTLHAEPGGTYDIAPASGRAAPDIPQGWFTPLEDQDEGAAAEGDAAATEPGSEEDSSGEPVHDEDPDDEDEHSTF
jgi:hypothetical protein